MKMKLKNFTLMTHEEYKANISGLNIFFGAILGVVMADVTISSALEYSLLLAIIASYTIMLLYISASKHRLLHAAMSTAVLLYAWYNIYIGSGFQGVDTVWLEQRLLPTLSVWLFMIIFVEFIPRGAPISDNKESGNKE